MLQFPVERNGVPQFRGKYGNVPRTCYGFLRQQEFSQNNLNQMFWNASVGKVIWHTSAMWAFVFGNKRIKEKSKKFPEN